MRNVLFALLVAASCVAAGCIDDIPINWPKVAECGAGVDSLFGDVSRILLADGTAEDMSGAAVDALEKLAQEHGAGAIACLVEGFVSDWLAPGASPDPVRIAGARRGQDFLEEHGVERVKRE